ncbi:MAG: MgtC/SapB family protein [Thermodesulfobacteriota bacterium]
MKLSGGVTTASVIWILAAIGATIGLGYLMQSILLSILIAFILVGISILEDYIKTTGIGRRNPKG